MEFTWIYEKEQAQQVKYFLKEKGISKGLLAKIKFQGGTIMVNDQVKMSCFLFQNDKVTIVIPAEGEHETVLLDETPIEIVYEDEHLLVSINQLEYPRFRHNTILMVRWRIE